MTLLADVNHPGSQEDVASNWEHAHSLVKDAGSGAEIAAAPCLPALALSHACLSAFGEGGPYIAAGSHSFGIHSSLFCECTRGDRAVLEPFSGKFFFFSSGDPMLWYHVSSLRLSSGHSGPVLTLRTDDAAHTSLPSPHSLVVDTSIWAVMLAVVFRCVFGRVFFFSQLCCL